MTIQRRHPTVAEVEARNREREQMFALKRVWFPITSAAVVVVPALYLYLSAFAPGSSLSAMDVAVTVGCLVLTLYLWAVARELIQVPPPVVILRVGQNENNELLRSEPSERFQAWCCCPTCGNVDMHEFVPSNGAGVKRKCKLCWREWIQT